MGGRTPKNSRESREWRKRVLESADELRRRERWRELHLKQLHLKQTLTRKEQKELSYLDERFGKVDERDVPGLLFPADALARVSLTEMDDLEEQKMRQRLLEQQLREQREQAKGESQTTANEANRPS
jgi:hypothetical protein